MAESISLCESESSFESLINKIISFIFIPMANEQRMAQVHAIAVEISHREDSFDLSSHIMAHLFAKKYRRFGPAWSLT